MIVSRAWLQNYFDAPLPGVKEIAEALTFHAFEIDATTEETLDVKVLPNRAADCLSHRGIARELGAILELPLKPDQLRELLPPFPATDALTVSVEDARACRRYMGALVRGVKVGPSPAWLKDALESVGQRSVNNVVDATNYVMLGLGQPLHAFDASRLRKVEEKRAIGVRAAKEGDASKSSTEGDPGKSLAKGEKMTTLSGESFDLPKGVLLITDANADSAIGIAGVKGGKAAEITDATTDIIIESANFDGVMVRRAMQALKLHTEAGKRFQNNISPELAGYAMKQVLDMIASVAGGELSGVVDFYPAPVESTQVPCSLGRINRVLGTEYSGTQVENVFARLGLAYKKTGEDFTVDPPFERQDIRIPEDIVEEVGRIMGYDKVPAVELPSQSNQGDALIPSQSRFRGMERMKDQLVEQGFTEVSTQSFAKKGDIRLANPLDTARPYLRTSLEENLKEALTKAKQYAPLVLPPKEKPKLFEVGTVFPEGGDAAKSPTGGDASKSSKEGEYLELRMTEGVPAWGENFPTHDNLTIAKLEDYGKDYEPKRYELGAYQQFSAYPFITRDIAFWTPAGTEASDVQELIRKHATELLARFDQFDRFEKDGRISYAFRLVFQSFDRTLTDDEVNKIIENVSASLVAAGYEVR